MPRKKQAAPVSSLKPFYVILGVVAVIGAGAIIYAVRGGAAGAAATQPIELTEFDDPQALVARARGVAVGPADAPVQVLVFSDYMCPFCAQFALGVGQRLKTEFVPQGQVRMVYYDFPLGHHVHSFLASRAARCAEDQGRFWEYHDLLFARQNDWMYQRSAPLQLFHDYAREVALDETRFRNCVNSDEHAELVTANYALGSQLGVNATPWVFVNGRRAERSNDWAAMRALVEQHLAP